MWPQPSIGCSALVISSDRDYSPVEWKRQYAALMPRAEVAVIANSRHAAPLDSPEELNRLLLEFLARVAPLLHVRLSE